MLAAADAENDDELEKQSAFHKQQIEHNRQLADMQAKRKEVKEAEESLNVHFQEDDIATDEWGDIKLIWKINGSFFTLSIFKNLTF